MLLDPLQRSDPPTAGCDTVRMARRAAIGARTRRVLLLALTAAALLTPSAPAQAELKAIWGPDVLADGQSAWPLYRDLDVEVMERQLQWSKVALSRPADPRDPADPAYRWPAELDGTVAEARRYHIRLALLVKATPGWANGGRPANYAPEDPGDYADFLVAAARRYPSVRHWMIWGEPSLDSNFMPLPRNSPVGPRAYALLLDGAYAALKSVRRRNVVIGGMTFTGGHVMPAHWLRWMRLPNGRPPRLDWYGHNPFSSRFPKLSNPTYHRGLRDFSDLDTLVRQLRRVYRRIGRRPKLWLSEFTVQSDHKSWAFDWYVSRKDQARWVTAAYRIAHRHRFIAGLGWFRLLDDAAPDGLNVGLLDSTGQRKPAYYAYRRAR